VHVLFSRSSNPPFFKSRRNPVAYENPIRADLTAKQPREGSSIQRC
jgi:hypothetical protein